MSTQTLEVPETQEVPEVEPTTVSIGKGDLDWIVDNLLRQARERYIKREIIPDLAKKQTLALEPLSKDREVINEALKENTSKRQLAQKNKASKNTLIEILDEEAELTSKKISVQKKIEDKREDLGIAKEISANHVKVKAHEWRRYQQLDAHGITIGMGKEPHETESDDVVAYEAERVTLRKSLTAQIAKNL